MNFDKNLNGKYDFHHTKKKEEKNGKKERKKVGVNVNRKKIKWELK